MIRISSLFIYPVKSLAGIPVSSALLTDRGLQYDRRWMLVDKDNRFLTQREHPRMALLQPHITGEGILITHKNNAGQQALIPFLLPDTGRLVVNVWDDWCEGIEAGAMLNEWFSDMLQFSCKLVYMPEETRRSVDGRYVTHATDITSFSDGYPLLMISQASLDDLNGRMELPLPMNRFRPNLVLENTRPYEEDEMAQFRIGSLTFSGVKLCARCVVTTVEQDTCSKGKEPLKTLYGYRMKNNKVYFGQNVIHDSTGIISVGDTVEVLARKMGLIVNEAQ